MKSFFLLIFGLIIFLLIPEEGEAQSRTPLFENKSSFQPPSRSRPPGGTRRPLTRSRRSMALQQLGWEAGGNIGTAYSLTDVSGTSIDQRPSFLNTQWSTINLNIGGFARYKFHELFAVSGTLNYGRVSGADSLAGRARNFAFTNNIIELGVNYEVFVPTSGPNFPFAFYGFVGLAGFYHNPNLTIPDPAPNDFTLDSYSKFQPAIPMGFGFNYAVNQELKIGYEIGWRKTFFDYLDGFTRPWSKGSDSYYFGSLKISYFFSPSRRRW
jgi:hypothetical protein